MKLTAKQLGRWRGIWAKARNDILFFARWLGTEPTEDQTTFLLHIQWATLNQQPGGPSPGAARVLGSSGQGCGKTRCMVIAALWRHFRSPGTKTIITAPTAKQCSEVFFAELQQVVAEAPPVMAELLEISSTSAHVRSRKHGRSWKISARTASNPDCMRGLHHRDMTICVEELSGIEDDIMKVLIGTCSEPGNLIIGVQNPSQRTGVGFDAFYKPSVMKAWPRRSVLDRERLSQERPDICDPAIIRELEEEYGRDSDFFRVAVRGLHPNEGGGVVLPYDKLLAATKVPFFVGNKQGDGKEVISMDFARMGGDECAVVARQGNAVVRTWFAQSTPLKTVHQAVAMWENLGSNLNTVFVMDATGMGQGMLDVLPTLLPAGMEIVPHHNHGTPGQHGNYYKDRITRCWFELRRLLRTDIVSLPADDELIDQLAAMCYDLTTADNKLKVWDKDKYKKESGKKSPDRAEALVMSFLPYRKGGSMAAPDLPVPGGHTNPYTHPGDRAAAPVNPYGETHSANRISNPIGRSACAATLTGHMPSMRSTGRLFRGRR